MNSVAPSWLIVGLKVVVYLVLALMVVYTLRHMLFTLNRLFGRQRHPYLDIDTADWPQVTVVVPAHNEAAVIANALDALADVDYPVDRYEVVAVDDRSSDETWAVMQACSERHPEVLRILRRTEGLPGKAAVLKEVSEALDSEILIVFDADYVPGRGLIKQIAAPFFDAEIGAVMGRVVPHNTASNLLTRLLDLERAGGYQVDQQARMNLRLLPQYGGSVGGVRLSALRAVGGWRVDVYAEDTDLTYRLMLAGFKTVYENRCECYEEVPEVWQERNRQIMRWAKGHNQVALRHLGSTLRTSDISAFARLDAVLLLGVYMLAPLLLLGFLCGYSLFLLGQPVLAGSALVVFGLVSFSALGNYAAFFEIAAALHLDGSRKRLRLLPLNFLNFLVSLINITRACGSLLFDDTLRGKQMRWDKTARYRANGKTP
jgi:cellulose synthase/poly-beta-1,6-N-acetylglucosamine synthase-like glycosyltransferase